MSYFSSALSFSHFLLDQYTTCFIIIHPKNRNNVPGRVPLQQEPSFFSPSWHYFFKEQTELTESQISSFILLPIHSNLAFFTTHSIVIIKAMIYFCLFFFLIQLFIIWLVLRYNAQFQRQQKKQLSCDSSLQKKCCLLNMQKEV